MARTAGRSGGGGATGIAEIPHPTLLYTIKQVELVTRSHLDELVKPAGITALQYTALTVLRRRDGMSSAQLARNSFVTAQSTADMVTALERRGLITRRRNPDNRRVLLLSLTEAGRELLDTYEEAVQELEERMVSGLTPSQRRNLVDYLNRCRAALSETSPH